MESPWSSITGLMPLENREALREKEVETLEWMSKRITKRYNQNETASVVARYATSVKLRAAPNIGNMHAGLV